MDALGARLIQGFLPSYLFRISRLPPVHTEYFAAIQSGMLSARPLFKLTIV